MRKFLASLFSVLIGSTALAQQKGSVVKLISSSQTTGVKQGNVDFLKVYNGIFQQNNSTLRSDSAYFYPQSNSFDAFGNVNINQGDSLNIYADKLNYSGNTNIAILTNNVRMVDRDAVLSTNYLTYNTATKIGTYTGGGTLVNKTTNLVSKNGYYFANSRDAYFRYDVVLKTPEAVIKSDTLRYNSGSKIAFFYGPTNIYGKDDTLYTENGTYNTETEQAFFGKKNLYKQGSKTLQGDSLFYDRKLGYGRAVKNITFNDTEQNITLKGDLGVYHKQDERTVVTQNAYVIIVTEQRDTIKRDSMGEKLAPDSNAVKASRQSAAVPGEENNKEEAASEGKVQTLLRDSVTIKRDSIFMTADTLETQMLTVKALNDLQEKQRMALDTSRKTTPLPDVKPPAVGPAFLTLEKPKMKWDSTSFLHPDFFGKPKKASIDEESNRAADSAALTIQTDTLVNGKPGLSDTSRIRILRAYNQVKVFKSDLQMRADSLFYSTGDSTMRCFDNPMIWTQNSQLSADTINLQMKNQKLDNMDLIRAAIIVNTEGDSTYFNQVGGKKMKGYFVEGKLHRMFVDGNAESIYFNKDSTQYTTMNRTLSSRIRVNFKNNEPIDVTWLSKPEGGYFPIEMVTEDRTKLENFKWKPEDRPVSKEAIIPGLSTSTAGTASVPAVEAPQSSGLPDALGNIIKQGTDKIKLPFSLVIF